MDASKREGRTHRHYGEEALARLQKIHTLKELGLSLEEIREVIDLYFEDATGLKGKRRVLEILKDHLKETDEKIDNLQGFREELVEEIKKIQTLIQQIEKP